MEDFANQDGAIFYKIFVVTNQKLCDACVQKGMVVSTIGTTNTPSFKS